jgi:short-chain fatty acids transporter
MKFTEKIFSILRNSLPSPLSIALLLTVLVFVITLFTITPATNQSSLSATFLAWENGLWSNNGLVFLVQMMLMLILGHVIALTQQVNAIINRLVQFTKNPQQMVWVVCFATLLVSWVNWGLGLVFGAILCRKIGEHAELHQLKINYALIGTAGYAGLMFWHGGLSGSALIKVSEQGHLASLMENSSHDLPAFIGFNETAFSIGNIIICGLVLLIIPMTLRFFAQNNLAVPQGLITKEKQEVAIEKSPYLAERLDSQPKFGLLIGIALLVGITGKFISSEAGWAFISPNTINITLLGLAFLLHGSIRNFSHAIERAISDGTGILIQFPLYFGIMGLMSGGNLIEHVSSFFVSISSAETFPIWAFFSAGLVNLFVPSGGGQWMIQGPIIIEACQQLGVPLSKGILALAYGDQITNMLQPFWALPLLGITKLKAQDLFPYTFVLFIAGTVIYLFGLMFLL